jgi:hypothetical protein
MVCPETGGSLSNRANFPGSTLFFFCVQKMIQFFKQRIYFLYISIKHKITDKVQRTDEQTDGGTDRPICKRHFEVHDKRTFLSEFHPV